jgi:glycerol-3-phosphate dehydrogenase (NAD(P)+)
LKITVIAAGSWGTALAMVLDENGHEVTVWARNEAQITTIKQTGLNEKYLPGIKIPATIDFTSDLTAASKNAQVILFSTPTQQFRSVLTNMVTEKLIGKDALIVNVSKGIDMETLETVSQITARIIPDSKFVALSGPSHAEEVAAKLPTALVSASLSRTAAESVQDIFTNDYLRVYTNPDVIGVEISGALKNIIAVGAGISDGLGYGDNAKAALITRGIKEIATLGIAMGAKANTFKGLAGVGDLIVTCTSMHSRNRRCGILIGEGNTLSQAIEKVGMVVEGAYTVKAAYDLMKKYEIEMPITAELYRVLYEDKNAREAVNHLMTRRRKHELDEYATDLDLWV